jgi:MFS family permease
VSSSTDIPPTELAVPATNRALLGQADYVRFWFMRWSVSMATLVQTVVMGWQVYSLARADGDVQESALQLGWLGLASFAPMFVLTLPAGWAADHFPRKRQIFAAAAVDCCTVSLLLVLTMLHEVTAPRLIAIAVAFGASKAFIAPAVTALAPMLVPRALLPRAIAWNTLSWQSSGVIGPAVGGLLVAISPLAAYIGSLAFYLIAFLCLAGIKSPTRPQSLAGSPIEKVKEGLVYIWKEKIVFGAISLDLVAVLLGGATALLPVYARDVLQVGPEGFGILRAAPAIGATLVGLMLAAYPIRQHAGTFMLGGVAVFGAATVVFGLSKVFWLSVAALAVLGAADMLSVFVRQALIQVVTPDPMRGRVAAVSTLFVSGSNELGEFETGLVARFIGPVAAAVYGGIGAILATGLWAAMFPQLRKADRLV